MTHTQATHKPRRSGWLQHIRHWLAHPTSEMLPPIFGDTVPPDLRVFEAKVDEARHKTQEMPAPPAVHGGPSKRARRKKSSVSSP
jgi:hypothetical protein